MILKQIAKKIKIPEEKMPISLHRFGNTSGASPFLTLCDAYGTKGADENLKVFLCAFGVGLSWGASALNLNTADILPIIEDDTIFEEGVIRSVSDLL
jgi:3-oxoacyl-[acyl-carrier-protein] synthase-3